MSELTISGRIALILPLQTGTSKAGNPWKKQGYILETGGQYPRKVCFSLFGDKVDQFPIQVGQDVTVSIDIESREFNGRWYTEINAWNIVQTGAQPAAPAPQQVATAPAVAPVQPQPAPQTPQQQAVGDLPF
jgi:hypothetical protein